MGIRHSWACALYAAGGDVFLPRGPLDPELDPAVAIEGVRGVSLAHDGEAPSAVFDAMVGSELRLGAEGWRLPINLVERGRPNAVLPGGTHRGRSAVLDVMTHSLRSLCRALDLKLPRGVGWRALLGARTIDQGLHELRSMGLNELRRCSSRSRLLH